ARVAARSLPAPARDGGGGPPARAVHARAEAVVRTAPVGTHRALCRARSDPIVSAAVRRSGGIPRGLSRQRAVAMPGARPGSVEPVLLSEARVPEAEAPLSSLVHVDLPRRPEHAERPGGRARQHLRDRLLRD